MFAEHDRKRHREHRNERQCYERHDESDAKLLTPRSRCGPRLPPGSPKGLAPPLPSEGPSRAALVVRPPLRTVGLRPPHRSGPWCSRVGGSLLLALGTLGTCVDADSPVDFGDVMLDYEWRKYLLKWKRPLQLHL